MREEHYGHSLYLRMNLNERIQHISLAVSFMLLVITGFMFLNKHIGTVLLYPLIVFVTLFLFNTSEPFAFDLTHDNHECDYGCTPFKLVRGDGSFGFDGMKLILLHVLQVV